MVQTFCCSAGGVGLMLQTSVMLVDAAEGEPISSTQVQLITPRVPTVSVPEKTLGLTVANFLIYRCCNA